MTLDLTTLLTILGMALTTYGTRVAGLFVAGRLVLSDRAQAAFDAIPAAVLTALIAPMVLTTGPAETIAAVITCLAACRLSLLPTIGIGVVSVVLLRTGLGAP